MLKQNSYRIVCDYKRHAEWSGWIDNDSVRTGYNWQDAIQKLLDDRLISDAYKVVSETPLEDGRSGIIEIRGHSQTGFLRERSSKQPS